MIILITNRIKIYNFIIQTCLIKNNINGKKLVAMGIFGGLNLPLKRLHDYKIINNIKFLIQVNYK